MSRCQVSGCENEATTARRGVRTTGPTRFEVTVRVCEQCAAEMDGGTFQGKLEFPT
jgi:hypothetical protein